MFKKLLTKVLLTFLAVYTAFLTVLTPVAKAQTWYSQTFPDWYLKVFDTSTSPESEIFGERYTAAQVLWVYYSLPAQVMTLVLGPDFVVCVFTGDLANCGAAIIARINAIGDFFGLPHIGQNTGTPGNEQVASFSLYKFFYNNPLSGTGYLLRKASRFHIVPEAEAQGFGFTTGASAVQELWKATRNISYLLLVFVIIILSFMIMFRVKLSPQVVIGVQSALPRVVIALVLITFSYAIAGFLIDLMYVVIGLIATLYSSSGLSTKSSLDLFRDLTHDREAFVLSWQFAFGFFFAAVASIISASPLSGLLMVLFSILVILISIWYCIKISWVLIKTFISIMLLIVAAPLQILLGTIVPGMGFGPWVKSMLANLMVYPTVGLLFILAFFFLSNAASTIFGSSLADLGTFIDPFNSRSNVLATTTSWNPPLTFGTNGARWLWLMAAFAIYSIIPKAAEIIKSIITGREFAYGTAIGEAIGGVTGFVGGTTVGKHAKAEVGGAALGWAAKIFEGAGGVGGKPRRWVAKQLRSAQTITKERRG